MIDFLCVVVLARQRPLLQVQKDLGIPFDCYEGRRS